MPSLLLASMLISRFQNIMKVVSAKEGVCLGGCLPGGVCLGGGVCLRGMSDVSLVGCLPGGVYFPPNRITDRCKNITFPQLLLRTVIKIGYWFVC